MIGNPIFFFLNKNKIINQIISNVSNFFFLSSKTKRMRERFSLDFVLKKKYKKRKKNPIEISCSYHLCFLCIVFFSRLFYLLKKSMAAPATERPFEFETMMPHAKAEAGVKTPQTAEKPDVSRRTACVLSNP